MCLIEFKACYCLNARNTYPLLSLSLSLSILSGDQAVCVGDTFQATNITAETSGAETVQIRCIHWVRNGVLLDLLSFYGQCMGGACLFNLPYACIVNFHNSTAKIILIDLFVPYVCVVSLDIIAVS